MKQGGRLLLQNGVLNGRYKIAFQSHSAFVYIYLCRLNNVKT